jgi:hypothetical protein
MRRSSKRRTGHDRDCISPAANSRCVRSTGSSNDRIHPAECSARRLLRYDYHERARPTESGARRMRHNIDRCGSTKFESAGCRCRCGCAIPTLSARQDVQWRIMRDMIYVVMNLRITSLRRTCYTRRFTTRYMKDTTIGFPSSHPLRRSLVHQRTWAR